MPDSPPPDLTNEAESAFVRAAGFVVDTVTATEVVGHLEVGADHHTPWGIVHGGVYSAAIESAAGVGASAAVSVVTAANSRSGSPTSRTSFDR